MNNTANLANMPGQKNQREIAEESVREYMKSYGNAQYSVGQQFYYHVIQKEDDPHLEVWHELFSHQETLLSGIEFLSNLKDRENLPPELIPLLLRFVRLFSDLMQEDLLMAELDLHLVKLWSGEDLSLDCMNRIYQKKLAVKMYENSIK